MAAGNIIKYLFLTTMFFFGTKFLILVKQLNGSPPGITETSLDKSEDIRNFGNSNLVQDNTLVNTRDKRFDEYSERFSGNDEKINGNEDDRHSKLQGDGEQLETLVKKGNSTVVKRVQRKRKLLSQLWDEYYKVRQTKTDSIKDGSNFFQLGEDIFIFSAYLDDRDKHAKVRILGISKSDSTDILICKFSNTRVGQWIPATKIELSDSHNKPYRGVMYICHAPQEIGRMPPKNVYLHIAENSTDNFSKVTPKLVTDKMISVEMSYLQPVIYQHVGNVRNFSENLQKANNTRNSFGTAAIDNKLIELHRPDKSKKIPDTSKERQMNSFTPNKQEELSNMKQNTQRISVCVSPLFGDIRLSEFIQFVEVHKIFGVDHIFFYKMNISSDIEQMLEYYNAQGVVTVTDWSLPSILQHSSNIWYKGQVTALQDCLYRNIGKFDLTAFVDLDEIIVPYTAATWHGMLQTLKENFSTHGNSIPAVYSFKSAFFEPVSNVNENSQLRQRKLSYLRNIYRTTHITSVRTKVIVQPKYIEQIGIHHVSKLLKVQKNLVKVAVPIETALIHHYRKCTEAHDTTMHCGKYEADDSLLRYSDLLMTNYEKTLEDNIPYLKRL